MYVPYKAFPVKDAPAFNGLDSHWLPTVVVNLTNPKKHTASRRFEAIVDSGAAGCIFHASIGRAIGLDIESGKEGPLGGVVEGATIKVYYHKIKLGFMASLVDVYAGFSENLACAGLLGRYPFFDSYTIKFDPCSEPPGMEFTRIGRA